MESRLLQRDAIPIVIRIGVIGHRSLHSPDFVTRSAESLFADIKARLSAVSPTCGFRFVISSSLAEGADRLLARAALSVLAGSDASEACLFSILPMEIEKFARGFSSDESRAEFESLVRQSCGQHINPPAESNEIAYTECSQLLVDNCDILIAVWNGHAGAGPGGTASSITYAQSQGRHIYIIDSNNRREIVEITPSGRGSDYVRRMSAVEGLNQMRLGIPTTSVSSLSKEDVLSVKLDTESILLSWLNLADSAARSSGLRSRLASDAIQWLSVAAVLLVTAQTLFFPSIHEIVWGEVIFMGIIVVLSAAVHQTKWQKRWADYRYCAERLRAYRFLWKLPDDLVPSVRPANMLFRRLPSGDWASFLLDWVWHMRFTTTSRSDELDANYFLNDWIQDQIEFYRRRQQRLQRLDQIGTIIGLGLFLLTAMAAVVHVLNRSPEFGQTTVFVAIAGPALAGGLAGVRSHRDHQRLMERYRQCADQLELVAQDLRRTKDRETAVGLILTAHNIMLAEHSDWRITVHTKDVGPK